MKIKLKHYLKHLPGWSTNRKFLILESDDWGSIRMPSNQVRLELEKNGLLKNDSNFLKYDTLADKEDLDALFGTLSSVSDLHGNNAVFSPFVCVSNPDFRKIIEADYQEYFWEPFTTTLNRYYGDNVFPMWKAGMKENLFIPQFHGREHVNAPMLLKYLQNDSNHVFKAFHLGVVHLPIPDISPLILKSLAPAYFINHVSEMDIYHRSLEQGISLFQSIFHQKPVSFAAPNGIFHPDLEQTLAVNGIKGLVVNQKRLEPNLRGGLKSRSFLLSFGRKNHLGQVYYKRNVKFEPVQKDYSLNQTLFEIKAAFQMGKPAVVTSHRLNYIGVLSRNHREKNLEELRKLLQKVIIQHPDIEFISTTQLVNLMNPI
ncbi:MAG TPA: hypothetical protein PKC30_03570 [Saprospiraceae bacterium]|nr:hypothetical protein [Saprospiraceae bacterium]